MPCDLKEVEPIPKPVNEDSIRLLEEALEIAKTDGVNGVALVLVKPDKNIITNVSDSHDYHLLVAGAAYLMNDLINRGGKGE